MFKIIETGQLPLRHVSTPMTGEQERERYLVLTSRTGIINATDFKQRFKITLEEAYGDVLEKHIADDLVKKQGDKYIFTTKGRYLQSDLAVDYMRSIFKIKD